MKIKSSLNIFTSILLLLLTLIELNNIHTIDLILSDESIPRDGFGPPDDYISGPRDGFGPGD